MQFVEVSQINLAMGLRETYCREYDPQRGVTIEWDSEAQITIDAEEVLIRADPAGLRNLAHALLTLAQADVPPGTHIHVDDFIGVTSGSLKLERA